MEAKPTHEELEQRVRELEKKALEHKRIVDAIDVNEARYRELFETSRDGIAITDFEGRYLDCNRAYLDLLGYSSLDEIRLKSYEELTPPEYHQFEAKMISEQTLERGYCDEYEKEYIHKTGTRIPVTLRAWLRHDVDKTPSGMWVMVRDITDRKEAEDALRQSEGSYRTLAENLPGMVYRVFVRENNRMQFFNDTVYAMTGYEVDELTSGKVCSIEPFIIQEDRADVVAAVGTAIMENRVFEVEYRFRHKDGDIRYFFERGRPILGIDGKPLHIDGVIIDVTDRVLAEEALRKAHAELERRVEERTAELAKTAERLELELTERKRAEEALRESKAHIQLIVDNIPYVIFQIDKDLKVLWANKVGREINPDAVGQPCYKAFAHKDVPCEYCNCLAAISTGQIVTYTMHHPSVEGIQGESYWEQTAVPLRNDQGEVIGAIELSNNITERKRLEVQLQQAQKMKAIATLAGGIAHEFNNALVGISGNIELLQMDLPNGENIDKYVERTKESIHRMVGLTNMLLAYAKGGKYRPKTMSLNDLVEDTIPLIHNEIYSSIRVETDLPGDISHVEADPTQMQMVLSSVLNNAAEAIEGEGRIRIITRDEKIDKEFVETHPYFKPGHYVCLTIEDEGKGMDEETRSGVFEPFFTTKFQGRGLGMAAVYGIIKNHGGSILVDSELGKGTAVRIYLPAVEARVEQPRAAKIEMTSATGTILVIEDEDVVIDVIGPMLERLGYRMLLAKTGREAIEIAKGYDGDIDLAIIDIVLPDMGGKEVYPLIMEARPSLKVIVCSGYVVDGPGQEILDAGAEDYIQKPFSIQTLSQKLKEVLRGQTIH